MGELQEQASARKQVQRWSEDLIDLTKRNGLLFFKHTKTSSFEFAQSATEVVDQFQSRSEWKFHLPDPPTDELDSESDHDYDAPDDDDPDDDELVVSQLPKRFKPQIERGLKNLKAKAQSEFLDSGIWVLYLGLGMLEWVDVDGQSARSPLLLMPVELRQVGSAKQWRLSVSDQGEATLNPALVVKLQKDFGVDLPSFEESQDMPLGEALRVVSERTTGAGWEVTEAVVLRTFTFHKAVIYRDLQDNGETIADHPVVQTLVEGPTAQRQRDLEFEPEPEELLDHRHPPEDLACVLDADATQRQCLIAARDGRSFVMDGPPGTGKSQTITNVIAQLLADGKTVLFVSEKAAALEVVQNRLAALKLDPFVLALHSKSATRKEVAQTLGKALDERPAARERMDESKTARLRRDRMKLTDYAVAMNEVRRPLGRSLHDVIGRASQLQDLPTVPVAEVDTADLDPAEIARLLEASGALSRSWGPIDRAETFVWRDLRVEGGSASTEDRLRRLVESCIDVNQRLKSATEAGSFELGVSVSPNVAGASHVERLLSLASSRLDVGVSWLSSPDAQLIAERVMSLSKSMFELEVLSTELDGWGQAWRVLSPASAASLASAEASLSRCSPPVAPEATWKAAQVQKLRASVEVLRDQFREVLPAVSSLAKSFGVEGPVTLELADRLSTLGSLAGSTNPPEPAWLNPITKAALDEARRILADLLTTYRSRRKSLQTTFKESVLDLDLRALHKRFSEVHTGLHKLGGAYRTDKATLSGATVSGKVTNDVLAKMEEAIEWQDLAQRLRSAEERHAPQLGSRYYASRAQADLDEIERAVTLADQALALAGADIDSVGLAKQIGLGGTPDPRLPKASAEVAVLIKALRSSELAMALQAKIDNFESLTLPEAMAWCDEVLGSLTAVADLFNEVDEARSSPNDYCGLKAVLDRRSEHASREARQAAERIDLQPHLGELNAEFKPKVLSDAVRWVKDVLREFDGKISERAAKGLLTTDCSVALLEAPLSDFHRAQSGLLAEFSEPYGAALRGEILNSFEVADSLFADMRNSLPDAAEWREYTSARQILCDAGWQEWLESCENERLSREVLTSTLERVILTRWADRVIAGDARLQPRRSADRDDLLAGFRALDSALVADSAAKVINTCSARLPKTLLGGSAIIRQQSLLKARHKPVRKLLMEAGDVAQKIKPCFMMSPISVSQFLPPQMRFDVVIFDEASQVREADAICCIYRGDQLIVAGDPKQLPPTDFFSRTNDSDDDDREEDDLDFESVLDRCKAQGLQSLPLNWHYRSQHESLISFSNYSFYDGRLHTFPGAIFESRDLGVELFKVDGQYRRGSTRDNPIEAEAVVDRIIFHRQNHPELTLGVVALSVAQQVAIEVAIERRSSSESELRKLVTDDRLNGFFVKNLENVQGDERDLIILSVGYGPDENGKLLMHFGPLNKMGGERRLNVAITRARRRVEVVSSISSGQISDGSPSVNFFRKYLDFAERGQAALAIDLDQARGDAESPFEEEVIRSIIAMGFDAVPQVGVAGYRLDIAVKHPKLDGQFVLGVECDGAAYHSSKVARDRDRLRQQVLEALGWQIHRIWSTAWFSDRPGQEARLRESIEIAIKGIRVRSVPAASDLGPTEVEIDEVDFDDFPDWAWAYDEPTIGSLPSVGANLGSPAARSLIINQVAALAQNYGPIHEETVVELLRDAWKVNRASRELRVILESAIKALVARGEIEMCGEFVQLPGAEIYVRVPEHDGVKPRAVKRIPPAELEMAILHLLSDAGTCEFEELRKVWTRLYGWKRTGPEIERCFLRAIENLVAEGTILDGSPLRLNARRVDAGA